MSFVNSTAAVLDEDANVIVVLVCLPDGRSFVCSATKSTGHAWLTGSGSGLPSAQVLPDPIWAPTFIKEEPCATH